MEIYCRPENAQLEFMDCGFEDDVRIKEQSSRGATDSLRGTTDLHSELRRQLPPSIFLRVHLESISSQSMPLSELR